MNAVGNFLRLASVSLIGIDFLLLKQNLQNVIVMLRCSWGVVVGMNRAPAASVNIARRIIIAQIVGIILP